ncbi:MAG: hypothetical protein H7Z19_09740 [Chitinophagaceae bacterium]|nr:hypothetical protein [Rubrivivax sp.]
MDNGGLGLAPAVPANYDDLAQRLQVRVDWLAPAGLGGALEVGTYAIKGTPAPVPGKRPANTS